MDQTSTDSSIILASTIIGILAAPLLGMVLESIYTTLETELGYITQFIKRFTNF